MSSLAHEWLRYRYNSDRVYSILKYTYSAHRATQRGEGGARSGSGACDHVGVLRQPTPAAGTRVCVGEAARGLGDGWSAILLSCYSSHIISSAYSNRL
jgi:hypothetical protein